MLTAVVNSVTVLIGGFLGLLLKKGIPQRFEKAIMTSLGLCVMYIGISGALKGENQIVIVISMVLGVILGTLIDIDKRIEYLSTFIERKFNKNKKSKVSVAQGFMAASLLFCVGAMTVTGSIEAGLGIKEGYTTVYTKSAIDFVSATVLASSLGVGVCFSSVFVLVFQGSLCLLASVLQPLLLGSALNELISVGSLMILALGFNMVGITKIKVANMMPALIFAPAVSYLAVYITSLF